jgi:peptide/nickel transport system permease protein
MAMQLGEAATAEVPAPRSRVLKRFLRHRLAVVGFGLILFLVLATAIGPHLIPFEPLQIDIRNRFSPPSFDNGHLLGTDPLGRDQLVRLLMAGRVSIAIGLAAMAIAAAIGVLVGATAGYFGGVLGAALMRFTDAMLCFPQIFLLLTLAAFVLPGPVAITTIIAATAWMDVARIVEAQTRALRERDYCVAARMFGAGHIHIILRQILPNAAAPIIVAATLTIARAILAEAYISFLGYGIQPPLPSWGNMLNSAQQYLASAPWLAIFPGLAIVMAVCSFNFLGDGLRDALDVGGDRK